MGYGGAMVVSIADSADVAGNAVIGDGSKVWHLAQVREDAILGRDCIVSRGAGGCSHRRAML